MRKFLTVTLVMVMVLSLMGGAVMAEDLTVTTADYEEEFLAAPAVAGLLLEAAGVDNRYGKGRDGGNYISEVARHMEPGTDFEGVEKTDVLAYEKAIALFLIEKGADVGADLFEAELESVWYEGTANKFGSEAGETLTLTFSNDVFIDGYDQVDAQTFVHFKDAFRLGSSKAHMEYTAVDNQIIITSLQGFGDPRPEIGDFVVAVEGIVDALGNPVIIPEGGVEVEGEEEPIITMNHELLDPSDPVFADSGGYFLNMGFEVNRDLNLTDDNVQFISYYEYTTNDEIKIVNDANGNPFARSKEWNFIRYGDLVNPESQPDVLEAGTQYFFAATGNTNNRLYSLATLEPGTEYAVRVVYVITDASGNQTTTYSDWVEYTR